MGKIIFWLVVFFAVLLVLRMINMAKHKSRNPPAANPGKAKPPSAMVRCIECGVFLPKADARPVPHGFHCGQPNCAPPRDRTR
jgi:hypothetical protein